MNAMTPMERLIQEGVNVEHDGVEVSGYWRGNHIWVRRSTDLRDGAWYIQVRHWDGGYLYDGWWENSDASPADAVAEAFSGACLLEDE